MASTTTPSPKTSRDLRRLPSGVSSRSCRLLPPHFLKRNLIHSVPHFQLLGPDDIGNRTHQLLPKSLISYFCSIINAMQYFPRSRKHATIICILKTGKPTYLPSNNRPISLLPILTKISERVILRRLEEFFEIQDVLLDF